MKGRKAGWQFFEREEPKSLRQTDFVEGERTAEELNQGFEGWRRWYNHQWPHGSLGFRPLATRHRQGMALDGVTVFEAFAAEGTRKVRKDGKIQVGKAFYQLPQGYEGRRAMVQRLGKRLRVLVGRERKLLLDCRAEISTVQTNGD